MNAGTASPPSENATPAVRSLADRLLGLVGAAMVVAAVVFAVAGGEADPGVPAPVAPPALRLIAPVDGATLDGELAVVFRSASELRQMPGGWGAESLHLHLELDGVQLMPSTADIQRLAPGEYRWVLPRPAPGEHTLRLFWSDADHTPLTEGASAPVRVRVAEE
jgi:hypothetical protein